MSVSEEVYNLLNYLPKCLSSQSSNSKNHYRSIFNSNILHNFNKNKYAHRTIGPAVVCKPDPTNPLRRRQNYTELPKIMPFTRPHRMPPIPKVIKSNQNESKSSKNYIQENIDKIRNSLPTCPRPYIVSDRKGDKYLVDGSGLQKDFIYKKNYGRIPVYLETRKQFHEQSNCNSKDNSMRILPLEERCFFINNLKERYNERFTEYQRLPLRLETTSAIMKNIYLTNELANIERDIDFLEKHQHIYIVDNYSDINFKNKNKVIE